MKRVIAFVVLAPIAVTAAFIMHPCHCISPETAIVQNGVTRAATAVGGPSAARTVVSPAPAALAAPPPPTINSSSIEQAFSVATPFEQNKLLTGLLNRPELDHMTVAFLLRIADSSDTMPLTRNNAVNCLLLQRERASFGLETMLARQITDRAEATTWRTYAVQHLASCYEFSNERGMILDHLWSLVASSDDGIASTALRHLYRLEKSGQVPTDQRVDIAVVDNLAPTLAPVRVITAVGIASERAMTSCASRIRGLLASADVGVQRAAIAALGDLGGEVDAVAITQFITDDRLSHVAVAALDRMHALR